MLSIYSNKHDSPKLNLGIDIHASTTSTYNSSVFCPITPRSPITPTSIISPIYPMNDIVYSRGLFGGYSVENTLRSKGHTHLKQVSEALQGTIWETTKHGSIHIIKAIKKSLHDKHITYVDKAEVVIQENIIKESGILKYLTYNDPPASLAKFVDCFSDECNYYLVMENAGHSFFEFVKKCHQYIDHGLLDITQWLAFCTAAMRQMVALLEWMHNTMHCCHLDVSLENFCISNVHVHIDNKTKRILRFNHDFQIKIIDFGLAEVFTEDKESGVINFGSTKYVGKTAYKAPKVYRKKGVFDARAADCWSLGVTLFMMLIGAPPFTKPSRKDPMFSLIMNGQILDILYAWDRVHYISSDLLDLFHRIFVKEKDRINIKEIQIHSALLL